MASAGAAGIVAGSLSIVLVTVLVVGAAFVWWSVRKARVWYRRARIAVGLVPGDRSGAGSRAMAGVASLPLTELSWWVVQRDRHRMWRAVTAAERSVAAAVAANAPIGDLAALTRRIRKTAESVDATLRACGPSVSAVRPLRQQVTELVAAAEQVRAAALEALTAVSRPATAGLTDAVLVEVAALRHGLTTMSAASRR
jgi:hypothetical protein